MLKYRVTRKLYPILVCYDNAVWDIRCWLGKHKMYWLTDIIDDTYLKASNLVAWWNICSTRSNIEKGIAKIKNAFWKLVLTKKQVNYVNELDWRIFAKSLDGDAHFSTFRTRGQPNTAYYDVYIYPFNFIKAYRRQYFIPDNEYAINTFGHFITEMLTDEELAEPIEVKTTLYAGFIWTKAKMFRVTRLLWDDHNHWVLLNDKAKAEENAKELVNAK